MIYRYKSAFFIIFILWPLLLFGQNIQHLYNLYSTNKFDELKEELGKVDIADSKNPHIIFLNTVFLEDGDVDMLGSLSAGETEVLAFSFLASLSSISGFEFPIIIDTLFGRISKKTRIKFTKMLPKILKDRQVIILVTDTEFTGELKEILKPHIAKYYKINYDVINKSSKFLEIKL